MSERRRWLRWWFELLLAGLLLAPAGALVVAGVLWLLQHDWFLWWALAAALISIAAWGSMRLRHGRPRGAPQDGEPSLTEPDPTWAKREQAAWASVQSLSCTADGSALEDRGLMLAAARETLEAVAVHFHPGRAEPALEFTVPELLLLTERVSGRMRQLLLEEVPLSHRIRARQLVRAWRYRPLLTAGLEHGRRAYRLVRLGRTINPLQALAAEFRDYVMNDLFEHLQTNVRRRIVRLWIEEIGRAAIDLYSGRMRVDAESLANAAAAEGLGAVAAEPAAPGPLRLLVAGRPKAGKSTLINGLLGELSAGVDVLPLTAEFWGYELRQDGAPFAYLIDSPGLEREADVGDLVQRAFESDLIVWIVPANRPDRALDRIALDALRARVAEDTERKMPPIVVVASHVDRLSPVREWAPPYDVETPSGAKAESIRAALDSIAEDLLVPIDTVVPMRLDTAPPYNHDLLWLRLEAVLEEARHVRWVRILRSTIGKGEWRRTWQQLSGAGRMVGWLVKREPSSR